MLNKEIVISFGGAVSASLKSSMSALSTGLGRVKEAVFSVNGALAGLGVGSVFAAVIANTKESADAMKQVEASIASTGGAAGYTADELAQMATELQGVTVYGDDAILAADSLLLTFTNVQRGGGIFKDAVVSILDMSAKLGTDLQSTTNQIGKALNDPIKGLAALTKVGVSFTAQQKDQIKTLAESGRMMEAQRIILSELQREFGGSAAIKTFADQLTAVGNAFGDLFEGSSELRPALTDLIATLQDPATKGAAADFVEAILSITAAAANGITTIITWGQSLGTAIGDAMVGFSAFAAQKNFDAALLGFQTAAQSLEKSQKMPSGSNLNFLTGGRAGVAPLKEAEAGFDKARIKMEAAAKKLSTAQAGAGVGLTPADRAKPNDQDRSKPNDQNRPKPNSQSTVTPAAGKGAGKTATGAGTPAKVKDAATAYDNLRKIADAEGKLYAAHQQEINAIQAGSTEAAARYQQQQEEYLAAVTAAGASKERVDSLAQVVGEITSDPNAQLKLRATIDPADLAAMPASIQAALTSGEYDITYSARVQVVPELITSGTQDQIQKQADASGTQGS